MEQENRYKEITPSGDPAAEQAATQQPSTDQPSAQQDGASPSKSQEGPAPSQPAAQPASSPSPASGKSSSPNSKGATDAKGDETSQKGYQHDSTTDDKSGKSPASAAKDSDVDEKDPVLKLDEDAWHKSFSSSVKMLKAFVNSFAQSYLDEMGRKLDLADKEGRKLDREFVLDVQRKVTDIITNMPKYSVAKFTTDDHALLESLNRNFKLVRYWVFGWVICAGLIAGAAIEGLISISNRSAELEDWYHRTGNAVHFGEAISKQKPAIYEAWYKGQWQKMTDAQRDSVLEQYQWKGW